MVTTQIIIVNYNSGAWLLRSLSAVLQFTDAQVVVVDNNSSDESIIQAKLAFNNEARLSWQLNHNNVGFAAANNQVLRTLTADFALLINPDCELNQDTLDLMTTAFLQNPNLGLASCRIYNEDGSLQATCRRRFPTPWTALVRMFQLHRLFPNNPKFDNFDYGALSEDYHDASKVEVVEAVSGAFMMVRKESLQEVGLLDEKYFMHCEDLDWCKRFEKSRWDVGFVSAAAVIHAKGISSKSRPIKVLWTLHKGMNRFFDKHYYSHYSWFVRALVKIGIICSFICRSSYSFLKSLMSSAKNVKSSSISNKDQRENS